MWLRLKKELIETRSGLRIYIVNGAYVRIIYDMDFTEGSNYLVAKYIPKNEIWIDEIFKHKPKELKAIIYHEVREVARMKTGMSYNKAHKLTNKDEKKLRIKTRTK